MSSNSKHHNFSDLFIGQTATHSVTIDGELIRAFAALTGDHHPLHMDSDYAISNGFSDVLVHGMLLTSLGSKLIGMDLPGEKTILLGQASEYLKPVFPGDVLLFLAKISHLKSSLRLVTVQIDVTNQYNELVSLQKFSVKLRDV
jgi:3-hydroxybutyryl-CoA dehydratase